MNPAHQSSDADRSLEVADQIDEAALAEVMRVAPLGAGVLAGTAVATSPWLFPAAWHGGLAP